MPRNFRRALIMLGAILLALLPLIEFVDHWESFGSDPEFVSICTGLGIAFALVLLIRSAVLHLVKQFRTLLRLPAQLTSPLYCSAVVIQTVFPRIRPPIRI